MVPSFSDCHDLARLEPMPQLFQREECRIPRVPSAQLSTAEPLGMNQKATQLVGAKYIKIHQISPEMLDKDPIRSHKIHRSSIDHSVIFGLFLGISLGITCTGALLHAQIFKPTNGPVVQGCTCLHCYIFYIPYCFPQFVCQTSRRILSIVNPIWYSAFSKIELSISAQIYSDNG